jgi:hypothetical protein
MSMQQQHLQLWTADDLRLALHLAGLDDDALAHLVLIGMLSTAEAQLARRLRPRS